MAKAATTTTTTDKDAAKTATLRKFLKKQGRKKRALKLQTDKEFAKTFFAARSKRSTDKKSAFRKKKSRKK
jgi:hypothetical protein